MYHQQHLVDRGVQRGSRSFNQSFKRVPPPHQPAQRPAHVVELERSFRAAKRQKSEGFLLEQQQQRHFYPQPAYDRLQHRQPHAQYRYDERQQQQQQQPHQQVYAQPQPVYAPLRPPQPVMFVNQQPLYRHPQQQLSVGVQQVRTVYQPRQQQQPVQPPQRLPPQQLVQLRAQQPPALVQPRVQQQLEPMFSSSSTTTSSSIIPRTLAMNQAQTISHTTTVFDSRTDKATLENALSFLSSTSSSSASSGSQPSTSTPEEIPFITSNSAARASRSRSRSSSPQYSPYPSPVHSPVEALPDLELPTAETKIEGGYTYSAVAPSVTNDVTNPTSAPIPVPTAPLSVSNVVGLDSSVQTTTTTASSSTTTTTTQPKRSLVDAYFAAVKGPGGSSLASAYLQSLSKSASGSSSSNGTQGSLDSTTADTTPSSPLLTPEDDDDDADDESARERIALSLRSLVSITPQTTSVTSRSSNGGKAASSGESNNVDSQQLSAAISSAVDGSAPVVLGVFTRDEYDVINKLPTEQKMKNLLPWLGVCHTFSSSVQIRIGELLADVLKDINNLTKRRNKHLQSPDFLDLERDFITALWNTLPSFPQGHQIQLKKLIEVFPNRSVLQPKSTSAAKGGLRSSKLSRRKQTRKPHPTFIPRDNCLCKQCSSPIDVKECNWCGGYYCSTCLDSFRPPCPSCKKEMTDLDHVILHQSETFSEGLKRIKGSFKQGDRDLQEMSFHLKLCDPYSLMRIEIPVRGRSCQHRAVFDLHTFLLRKGSASGAKCSFCNRFLSVKSLEVDGYVSRVLATESNDVREVVVRPDGTWYRKGCLTTQAQVFELLSKKPKSNSNADRVDLTY